MMDAVRIPTARIARDHDLRDRDVALWRLYALRAVYLLLVVGLGVEVWPALLTRAGSSELMQGVVTCVLAAVSLLAFVGLRYPLQMLPLLLFEMTWKALWLLVVAVPQWTGGGMNADVWPTAAACLMGIVFPLAIPWRYVVANYLQAPGDRWT